MQLEGSEAIQGANSHFVATMTNEVQWQQTPDGLKEICSDTSIQVGKTRQDNNCTRSSQPG